MKERWREIESNERGRMEIGRGVEVEKDITEVGRVCVCVYIAFVCVCVSGNVSVLNYQYHNCYFIILYTSREKT